MKGFTGVTDNEAGVTQGALVQYASPPRNRLRITQGKQG
jgi:hypothetical protein